MTSNIRVPLQQKAKAEVHGARRVGLIVVFFWFAIGGIAHFVATDLEASIVPPYVPRPRDVVLITGVLELLGAGVVVLFVHFGAPRGENFLHDRHLQFLDLRAR